MSTGARRKFPTIPTLDTRPAPLIRTLGHPTAAASRPFVPGNGPVLASSFSDDDPYTGVDLNGCLIDGVLSSTADRIMKTLDSYMRSPPAVLACISSSRYAQVTRKRKGHVEMYCAARYFTMTGEGFYGARPAIESQHRELNRSIRSSSRKAASRQSQSEPDAYVRRSIPYGKIRHQIKDAKSNSLWRAIRPNTRVTTAPLISPSAACSHSGLRTRNKSIASWAVRTPPSQMECTSW